jgi:multiple sugar transport system ATP-binding protein
MNLIDGDLRDGQVSAMSGKLRLPLTGEAAREAAGTNGAVTVGIRAEDVVVGPEAGVEARIHHVENHGVEQILTLRVDDTLFKATVPATRHYAIEDAVSFWWTHDKVHCFDRQTGISLRFSNKAAA